MRKFNSNTHDKNNTKYKKKKNKKQKQNKYREKTTNNIEGIDLEIWMEPRFSSRDTNQKG